MASAVQDTPEQQAAVQRWEYDAKRIALQAYRKYGRVGYAAEQANIDRVTFYRWRETDPQFASALQDLRLDIADELSGKGLDELRYALSVPGMVTLHPNHYFHELQHLEPGRRPNASVQIDARSITVNTLDEATAGRLARALAGASDSEEIA